MKFFKDYTFTWWEIGIFKTGMILVGALIGAYWADFFLNNATIIIVLAAASMGYTLYASFIKK